MKLTPTQSEHIEYAGRWWESLSGGSRTAGRLLGWLMICEPVHQSLTQLAEALEASAGSISTQSRMLETFGLVERVTFPGDRQTYYRLRPHVWTEIMQSELPRIEMMKEMARRAAPAIPAESPDRVTDLELVAQFFIDEWPGLMERLSLYLETEKSN